MFIDTYDHEKKAEAKTNCDLDNPGAPCRAVIDTKPLKLGEGSPSQLFTSPELIQAMNDIIYPLVKVKKLDPNAVIPQRATKDAAGMDLCSVMYTSLAPGERVLVKTGIAIVLPQGFEGQVRPRSGLALKHGITVLNSPGTIDADYRGEVGVILINHGHVRFDISPGDRIAQLVVARVTSNRTVEVEVLDETARGTGGFGSTGK